jgi:uncharacterized protein (TIGR02271 family)
MAIQLTDPAQLEGATVIGRDGDRLGKVQAVYFDNETNSPEWVAVKSGFFGSEVSLVPLATAEFDGTALTVPYAKPQLEEAPHHDPGAELSPADEADLFSYYGVGAGGPQPAGHSDTSRGRPAAGPGTDREMTRSEERLRVGVEQTTVGRARLRKHVVTEKQQVIVPVSHERVRIEREPITDADRVEALDGPTISEEEHEVTLHAERPVVEKVVHPVERVRLGTETVTEQQQVSGEVRREEIDVDDGRRSR